MSETMVIILICVVAFVPLLSTLLLVWLILRVRSEAQAQFDKENQVHDKITRHVDGLIEGAAAALPMETRFVKLREEIQKDE